MFIFLEALKGLFISEVQRILRQRVEEKSFLGVLFCKLFRLRLIKSFFEKNRKRREDFFPFLSKNFEKKLAIC